MRKKYSSNTDLRALTSLTKGEQFYTVNLGGDEGGSPSLGEEAESIVTNSPHLASVIKQAACKSCKDVEDTLEEEVKGSSGE